MAKNLRDIYGEYDPPYNINSNPTEEEKAQAQALLLEYEKRILDNKND